jgi:hypothetical protein
MNDISTKSKRPGYRFGGGESRDLSRKSSIKVRPVNVIICLDSTTDRR